MKDASNIPEFYRRKEHHRKAEAKRPVAEKLAIAAQLREVQEKLAPIRAANKATRSARQVNIRVRPDQN